MSFSRAYGGSCYHSGFLYAFGGCLNSTCKRLRIPEGEWETLPPMPLVCSLTNSLVHASSIYTFGGAIANVSMDLIQKFDVLKLSWRILDIKLPIKSLTVASFTAGGAAYFIVKRLAYSFCTESDDNQVTKVLPFNIESCFGASFYVEGNLYCSNFLGAPSHYEIGGLRV
mmetsp:Transcript_16599/g.29876  ORF Transcript_16599/g.29876 Transcript_16599/m.29876 type:complete len:170 (+) Transcript_16599:164-673(+)